MGERVLTPKYKWVRKIDREWLRFLIENELIVKVHAYRKSNPSFCVDPRDIKTNIKRYPFKRFESLRKKGAFYEPTMSGDWYLFFLRDDVKDDMSIFRDDLTAAECNIIVLLRKGMTAKRAKGNKGFYPMIIFDGDEKIGTVEGHVSVNLEEKGWLVENRKEGDETLYKFVDLDA